MSTPPPAPTAPTPPLLRPGARLPLFSLPSSRGVALGPKQYRQHKHLVLLCLDPETADGRTYLTAMADVYPEFQEMDAEVLALVPTAPAELAALATGLGLPFPLLADDGSARARLLPAGAPAPTVAMFVADRYGVLVHLSSAPAAATLEPPAEVLAWARYIGMQCSECLDFPEG
jgi:peroxiredoxin